MKEQPILFGGAMVRAILDGRKTQTRRIVGGLSKRFPLAKLHADARFYDPMAWGWKRAEDGVDAPLGSWIEWCPYGTPGDRLWARETFLIRGAGKLAAYRADIDPVEAAGYGAMYGGWKSPIYMPRWACRIVLEITSVRVERLQEISEKDVAAEGALPLSALRGMLRADWDHRKSYADLWDSLNAKRAPWDSNPWVWVVEFRRVANGR